MNDFDFTTPTRSAVRPVVARRSGGGILTTAFLLVGSATFASLGFAVGRYTAPRPVPHDDTPLTSRIASLEADLKRANEQRTADAKAHASALKQREAEIATLRRVSERTAIVMDEPKPHPKPLAPERKRNDNDKMIAFHDKPQDFKGQTLTFELEIDLDVMNNGRFNRSSFITLQSLFFETMEIKFKRYDERTRAWVEFVWTVTQSNDYPAAKHGDTVLVTFIPVTGERHNGIKILKIERP